MKQYILNFTLLLLTLNLFPQAFINGSFEINDANNTDQINLSNSALNAMLKGVTAFGSYGDVDIINSNLYGGSGAKHKSWYIALTGGKTDIVALKLVEPLKQGKKYSISFYDRKDTRYLANYIQIGLSTSNDSIGTKIYTTPTLPTDNIWTQRTFTFVAPNNGQYITVLMPIGDIGNWINIDDFTFTNVKCDNELKITTSENTVIKGNPVTFTVTGGGNYNWSDNQIITTTNENIFSVNPTKNTIYTVTSNITGCPILTSTIAIKVFEPKRDSIITPAKKIIDTIIKEPRFVKFNKRKLNGRKYKVQEKIEVTAPTIKINIYDKNRVDGDIVSVYLNGQLIEENLLVTKTKKEITINLNNGSNILVLYTINVGRIPPNTAALEFNSLSKRKITTLISDFKNSGAIEIIYNAENLTINKTPITNYNFQH